MMDFLIWAEQRLEGLMAEGGPVMWPLVGVSAFLWTVLLERFWFHYRQFPDEFSRLPSGEGSDAERIRSQVHLQLQIRRNMHLIRTLTGILPMLGLLGTVTGIVQTFDLIRLFGSADAKIIAQGVSQALITTLSGLVMGLCGIGLGHLLTLRISQEEQRLAERGAPP